MLVHVTTYTSRRDRKAEDDQKGEITYMKQSRVSFITNAVYVIDVTKKVKFYFLTQIKTTHNVQISL